MTQTALARCIEQNNNFFLIEIILVRICKTWDYEDSADEATNTENVANLDFHCSGVKFRFLDRSSGSPEKFADA